MVFWKKLWVSVPCTTFRLRDNNLLATLLVGLLAAQCRNLIEVRAAEREGRKGPRKLSFYSYHTGLNIALFPVIFFFSALYYTDVISTLFVLMAYRNHLSRLLPQRPNVFHDIWTVVLGVLALLMRQTNVFWVVVYMGGLEAVHVLRGAKPGGQGHLAQLHDPPFRRSGLQGTSLDLDEFGTANRVDWLFCALSIAVTALRNPVRVLRQIWPHLTILALFGGFVAWNGGVVLGMSHPNRFISPLPTDNRPGDKSNHIATIHSAQMLYIWPLFAFFSAPLLIPSFISALTRPVRYLRSLLLIQTRLAALFSLPYILLTILLSFAVVKYNTIIHPFTLADNRHYMFYVFRYTILRSPIIRLSLVPIYTLCRWLVWDQLAGTSHTTSTATLTEIKDKPTTVPDATDHQPDATAKAKPSLALLDEDGFSSTSPPTSTALIWLLTTTLSLVTAPLVEPRYFILPWVFYRLLLPSWSVTSSLGHGKTATAAPGGGDGGKGWVAWLWKVGRNIDVRLVLETVWFLVVNVWTMYMFLYKPFYWYHEDGRLLDGGRLQRFMW
jgi:alpha-1,2-glucosyltransferase